MADFLEYGDVFQEVRGAMVCKMYKFVSYFSIFSTSVLFARICLSLPYSDGLGLGFWWGSFATAQIKGQLSECVCIARCELQD